MPLSSRPWSLSTHTLIISMKGAGQCPCLTSLPIGLATRQVGLPSSWPPTPSCAVLGSMCRMHTGPRLLGWNHSSSIWTCILAPGKGCSLILILILILNEIWNDAVLLCLYGVVCLLCLMQLCIVNGSGAHHIDLPAERKHCPHEAAVSTSCALIRAHRCFLCNMQYDSF